MNKLYKALVYDNQVSLSVLETTELVQKAVVLHGLDDKSAEILGGMLTAAAYMAGCLKSPQGAVSLTVKSGGGSATVSVSGDSNGHIRGYIDGGEGGLGGGTLTVIKDDGFFRPFTGTCELTSADVSQNLMQYFRISEQIPTYVAIGVNVSGGVCSSAGGVVMQLLPGTSADNAEKTAAKMEAFANIKDVLSLRGADGIISEYFPGVGESACFNLTFPEYKCNCSRKKITGVLATLGKAELLDIIAEQGKIGVHCHYCNSDYTFTREDVEKLF